MNITIFKELTTEEKLQEIEQQSEQYQGLVVNMYDAKERKKVKDSASVINDVLKRLDRARIDKKKAFADNVESEAAAIRERLETANAPLTKLIDAHKEVEKQKREAEKARQAEIEASFTRMSDMALEGIGQTSTVIESIIDELSCFDFDPAVFQERTEEAVKKHAQLMGQLEQMLANQVASEEMQARQAEIERKERKQAEREEAERKRIEHEKIAQAGAEKARIEAEARHKRELEEVEQRRIREAEQAKQRQAEAEQLAKEQAEAAAQAERLRIEQEKAAQEEAERKRQADRKHKASIHNGIIQSIVKTGITEKQAKDVVTMIAKGQVANVRIWY